MVRRKSRSPPKKNKEFSLDIWLLKAISDEAEKQGISQSELVRALLRRVLNVKNCSFAKNYSLEKKSKNSRVKRIQVFCGGNWHDWSIFCLKRCPQLEAEHGKKAGELIGDGY